MTFLRASSRFVRVASIAAAVGAATPAAAQSVTYTFGDWSAANTTTSCQQVGNATCTATLRTTGGNPGQAARCDLSIGAFGCASNRAACLYTRTDRTYTPSTQGQLCRVDFSAQGRADSSADLMGFGFTLIQGTNEWEGNGASRYGTSWTTSTRSVDASQLTAAGIDVRGATPISMRFRSFDCLAPTGNPLDLPVVTQATYDNFEVEFIADVDNDGICDDVDVAICGDGRLGTGEICDDGNRTAGDGCSAACLVEAPAICVANPSAPPASICGIDTDGDGIPDVIDPDDDNDGILDIHERPGDTDGDGITDRLDPDDDGDGVLTRAEAADSNGNGSPDDARDTDGDLAPDYLDPDDDGDTVPTRDEAADPDGDGLPADARNTDGDACPDYLDDDDDNDTIPTATERADSLALTPPSFDLGSPDEDTDLNWLDTDADGDGMLDSVEGRGDSDGDGIPNYLDPLIPPSDMDGDSVSDDVECPAMPCRDSDGDGSPDLTDTDDDGDGIPTRTEVGRGDTDNDGTPDYLDPDDDGDTIPTREERPSNTDRDSDGDGRPDHLDPDDDDDGIPTATERADADRVGEDVDGDGNENWRDTDADGDSATDRMECSTPSMCPDTDNDGAPDYVDAVNDAADRDGDGITDAVECPGNTNCRDTDGDGMPDVDDPDDDGDGVPTRDERPGRMDRDTDGDGLPDHLDPDDDGDGIPTASEQPTTRNTDGEDLPDYLDPDDDNDGIPTRREYEDSEMLNDDDVDRDGLQNWLDQDSDADMIPDAEECSMPDDPCPDADQNSVPDYLQPMTGLMGGVSGGAACAAHPASSSSPLPWLALAALAVARRRRRAA